MRKCNDLCCGGSRDEHTVEGETLRNADLPIVVTAWHLFAHYGTGGAFDATRGNSKVVWTDAYSPNGGNGKNGDDYIIVARIVPELHEGRHYLRQYRQRVPAGTEFTLRKIY